MSHKMTSLDAYHARYAVTPWHKLGNVGHINWEDARDAFDWCEVQRHPIHIEHDEIGVILDGRNVLKMVNYPFAYAEVSDRYKIVQHRFMIDDLTGMLIDTGLVESIESVGTYDNGAVGYVSLKFKDEINNDSNKKNISKKYGLTNKRIDDFLFEIENDGVLTKRMVFAALRYERWLDLNQNATLKARTAILQELYQDLSLIHISEPTRPY